MRERDTDRRRRVRGKDKGGTGDTERDRKNEGSVGGWRRENTGRNGFRYGLGGAN